MEYIARSPPLVIVWHMGRGPVRLLERSMRKAKHVAELVVGCVMLVGTGVVVADWPQWRGEHRDGRASGFVAPAEWPKELQSKWKSEVGDGDATPALVGDKLYTFTRQGDEEVTTCLKAD